MAKEKSKIDVQTIGSRGAEGKKKLTIILVVIIVIAVAVNVLMASGSDPDTNRQVGSSRTVPMTPAGLEEQSFESETQSAIRSLRGGEKRLGAQIEENSRDVKNLKKAQDEFRNEMLQATGAISKQLDALNAKQRRDQEAAEKSKSLQKETRANKFPPADRPEASVSAVPPPPVFGSVRKPGSGASRPRVSAGAPPTSTKPSGPVVLKPPRDLEDSDRVKVSVEREDNSYAGWLSTGILPVVTLTGVQAGTASTSQQNPSPMLMRVQGNATLPGAAEYELRGCFVTGTSYGDARTHRAITDVATISCVDKNDRLVLEETLTGFVVDSDGIEGLRGTLKEKRGAILAKATLASMLEGLGQAFGDAQGTAFDSVTGGGTILSGGDAVRSSGLNAASAGANTLSQFYLQELERLFPVIEVPPNRKATVIITKGKSLKWHDSGSLFTKKTTPQ